MSNFASELIVGLERFADDLAAGRLEGYRDRITTWWFLDEPCPACGGKLAKCRRCVNCLTPGCRYSWKPEGGKNP